MSIEQNNIVDAISKTHDGKTMLTISDHLVWDHENEHLLLLQDKLNSYLRFIESNEIYQSYPESRDTEILIGLRLKYEPNENSLIALNRFKEILLDNGIRFDWQTISFTNENINAST